MDSGKQKSAPKKDTTNCVTEIAAADGRDYITPEDVSEAFEKHKDDPHMVRIDVLQVLGKQLPFGAEDPSLCAYIAYKGGE